jgi:glycosyltransferase involved in cell wall biosynthesis
MTVRTKCLKHAEEKYHRRASVTIVQDERRGQVLFADNGVKLGRTLYVPVSRLGPPCRTRGTLLRTRLGLSERQRIILQFGHVNREGLGVQLAQLAQSFPDEWTLILHGPAHLKAQGLERYRDASSNGRVVLSSELVPPSQLLELVSSAEIGLALYPSSHLNDTLTAFSSEKVALYLQCGVPVIAFAYPGYEILEHERCGLTINTIDELPRAIERILASLEDYSHDARRCFVKYYEFRTNYQKVVQSLRELTQCPTKTIRPRRLGPR